MLSCAMGLGNQSKSKHGSHVLEHNAGCFETRVACSRTWLQCFETWILRPRKSFGCFKTRLPCCQDTCCCSQYDAPFSRTLPSCRKQNPCGSITLCDRTRFLIRGYAASCAFLAAGSRALAMVRSVHLRTLGFLSLWDGAVPALATSGSC